MNDPEATESSAARVGSIIDAVAYVAIALLRSPDVATDVPGALKVLGEAADVSRIYIYQNITLDGELADVERFEWVAPGIPSTIDPDDQGNLYLPDYERYIRVLGTGGVIAELTTESPAGELAWLNKDDVLSYAIVPVFVRDSWWGYIGFDDCWTPRKWVKAELSALRVAAESLGAAFERQHLEERLLEAESKLRASGEDPR